MRGEKIAVWFMPEGHRNQSGTLLPFKSGAFRLAIAARRRSCPSWRDRSRPSWTCAASSPGRDASPFGSWSRCPRRAHRARRRRPDGPRGDAACRQAWTSSARASRGPARGTFVMNERPLAGGPPPRDSGARSCARSSGAATERILAPHRRRCRPALRRQSGPAARSSRGPCGSRCPRPAGRPSELLDLLFSRK